MPTPIHAGSASPATPVRRKAHNKRVSLLAGQDGALPDGSPTPSPLGASTRANVGAYRMNDDAAERAARRRSSHFADIGASSRATDKENSSGSYGAGGHGERKASALAVQGGQKYAERRAKRLSAVTPVPVLAATPAPAVSMEVMNTNFEEWMKLATDNKITATNTWNFALIDYFHDLTLLRNGPEDQSINFQKASCTLDGCVKIWTSRVDSVATETGKLLSGLAGGAGGDGGDGDGGDDEGGETQQRRKATLAKSFDALKVKKFDLEFTVDPLFKKTSADFDEGGAMGLLMNHLSIDGTGRVVFDASDAIVEDYEEEEEVDEEIVNVERLRDFLPSIEETNELTISETLGAFHFTSDPNAMPDLATITGLSSFNDDPPDSRDNTPAPAGTGEVHDFFGDDDLNVGGGGGGGGFDDGASVGGGDEGDFGFGEDEGSGPVPGGGGLDMAGPGDAHGPYDPRRGPGQELVMAFIDTDTNEGLFDYFDRGLNKAWAGAEHWKLRKISRRAADPQALAAAKEAAKEKRAGKAPFSIDFANSEAPTKEQLFAKGTKVATQLPGTKPRSGAGKKSAAAARREEWLLPDDMHFSSRQLLRLFLKPKFALRVRRSTKTMATENASGEIDETFWAQAAADRAEAGSDDIDPDAAPIPFETQFFHDDGDGYDDAYVDGSLDAGGEGDDADDLWQSTQGEQLNRPRPEHVQYAKRAKRVDVKRLKDDIWNDLKELAELKFVPPDLSELDAEARAQAEAEAAVLKAEADAAAETEAKTFDGVIQSLRANYPREKMSEISTSFCFICLLHLANEEGLRIETHRTDGMENADVGFKGMYEPPPGGEGEGEAPARPPAKRMDEGDRVDRIVGELQALKVYKDPNAGRAK